MAYCLNREELSTFLHLTGARDASPILSYSRITMASEWIEPLAFLTYTLACLLERDRHAGQEAWKRNLQQAFELIEEMYVEIQECDIDFTIYMMQHLRTADMTLEENLVDLERRRLEFRYDKALRY